jgi:hypothetical protein
MASFQVWGMLAGMGLAGVWSWLARGAPRIRQAVVALPVLLVGIVPLTANAAWAGRSGDFAARDWGWNLLQSLPPYSILFTSGDNDTFPLWYLQEVERVRRDVTVVVDAYLYTDWYPWQLVERTADGRQPPADAGRLPTFLGVAGPAPRTGLLPSDRAGLDAVAGESFAEATTLEVGPVAFEVPGGFYLDRAERLALRIIGDNLGVRPIYFSSNAGMIARLTLEPWGIHEGIVVRLDLDEDDAARPGLVPLPPEAGGGRLDFERSRRLAEEVYLYRGLEGRALWPDGATRLIPWYFESMFYRLAEGARYLERPESEVQGFMDRADAFRLVARPSR